MQVTSTLRIPDMNNFNMVLINQYRDGLAIMGMGSTIRRAANVSHRSGQVVG